MIHYSTLIAIFLIHWVSDFIFQSHNMATNKSKSNYWLTLHVGTYSFLTLNSWFLLVPTKHSINYLFFFLFVFATHWITDFKQNIWLLFQKERLPQWFCNNWI